jgi:5-methylcytosine-specific restriction endonuclease McrA
MAPKNNFAKPVEKQVERGTDRSSKDDLVRDKRALAIALGWRFQPFLMRFFREDVEQEIALLIFEHPEEMSATEWSNLAQRRLYRLAKSYSIKRGRGDRGFFKKEIPLVYIFEEEKDENLRERRIEVLLGIERLPLKEIWLADAYAFCREVISGGGSRFENDQKRLDWALFNAWLTGWSQEEISFAFGIEEALEARLVELATRIREAAGIDTEQPLPLPHKLGKDPRVILEEILGSGESPIPTRPRFVIPSELSVAEIQKRFWVSRQTAWRAKKRGWLVPGQHVPDKPADPEQRFDLSTVKGRHSTKRHILGRNGWWVELGAMWSRCGICGDSLLVSAATIDHIIPKEEDGPDILGNLQLAHYGCNQLKGARLPDLLAAMLKKSQSDEGL